jgi:hypothetical protein
MKPVPNSSGSLNELETELLKMKDVNHDIRIVLENILESKEFDKSVEVSIMQDFENELCMILAKVRQLPLKNANSKSVHRNTRHRDIRFGRELEPTT